MNYARYLRANATARNETATPSQASSLIRRTHRSIAILFTLTVAANFGAMAVGKVPSWITYSPLPFLFVLLATGLYLFALPYVRRGQQRDEEKPGAKVGA